MPDFLVSAATGALGPVLHKLAALLSDEYKRFKGVRDEVKFLIRELEAMHAFLLKKSEEENLDVQEKAWMKEVRELSYDIEDSLDDFTVRVNDDSTKPDSFIDKCKNLLAKTKSRRRIAKEIEKLKGQVKEVSERHARYKQIVETVMNTSNETVDPRALAIFEDASRLVGIDQPKQEVISFLMKKDGDISSKQPRIVSVVGIGGIGKTTIANRVYEELKDQFECRAFLSVSRNPDMANILRNILSQVTDQRYCQTGSIQQLIMEIDKFLRKKRYCIVVDDVWDVQTWDTIKYALSNNSCGSVIITTTRIHGVAKACCSLYTDGWVYKPKPLPEHDSKRLFYNRIFGVGNECPEYLKEVSDKILKKCGGLPLAIIAISGLLANKAQNEVHLLTRWDQVQISIGHGLERDSSMEGMMGILSLSYFDLPSHLKACLLYLSVFPEDSVILKSKLVRLWVAEGFIPPDSTCTLNELGEKYFNELINRNLILPSRINNPWTGEVASCRVHDTILDFIVRKSTEDNFVTVHGIPRQAPPPEIKVRRLSLQGEYKGEVALDSNMTYASARSIISFGFPCSLLGLRILRVLDITDFTGRFENHHLANIGELLQIRYLGLKATRITELPEQIGALQYLETLDLLGCNIIQLPTAIVRLKRLVNLLTSPWKQKCFPSGIRNLQALEFNFVFLDINAAAIYFEEIGDLTKMRHLCIVLFSNCGTTDEESYMDLMKKMASSLQRLHKLQTLNVKIEYGKKEVIIFDGDDIIVEVPWCPDSLRKLVLKIYPISRVPSWMKSLVNIEELYLTIKKLDHQSLCILGDLPVLVDLTLEIVNNTEGIPSTEKQRLVTSLRHFRSLRHFTVDAKSLGSRPSIPMLMFEAGSMPKLEELCIDFDADITVYASNGPLDFGLKHISKLTKVMCDIFGIGLNILRVEAALQKEIDHHLKLPSFQKCRHFSTDFVSEGTNRERLRPRRRSQSTVLTTLPKPPSVAGFVICTSGRDDKMSSSTTDDNSSQSLTVAPPLPTALSLTMYHHGASPGLARRHGQKRRLIQARPNATIRPRKLIKGAPLTPHSVKGTSGDDKMSSSTTNDNNRQSLTAALPIPSDLSFTIHHHGTSRETGRRHGQQRRLSGARQGATIRGREMVHVAPVISDQVKGTSGTHSLYVFAYQTTGAAPAPTDVLGPRLITAPQQPEAFVPPCFTFGSGSPPNTEDLAANAFISTVNELSLRDHRPDSSATVIEAACSDTWATPATPDVLEPRLIAVPQQQEALAPPRFTFSSGSPPNPEDLANAFASTFNGLSLRDDDHPGSSATAVEAASLDTGSSSCQGGSDQ